MRRTVNESALRVLPKGLQVDEAILLGKETATDNHTNVNAEERLET